MFCTKSSERKEYGVIKQGEEYIFTVALNVKKSVEIALYRLNGEVITNIDISGFRLAGNVYSFSVAGLPNDGFQYEYICDCKAVNDPYMRRHCLKRKFGVEKKPNEIDRAVFIPDKYDFEGDTRLSHDFSDVISYQMHVRGFTNHSSSKVKGKGCFLGIIEKIPYLVELGINQIELMPAYDFYEFDSEIDRLPENHPSFASDVTLDKDGNVIENKPVVKINYWGYKRANYFCPKNEYSHSKDAVSEFKDMVKALHKAGIEVIMQMYFDKIENPSLINDALKVWYLEFHVDGFHLLGEKLPLSSILYDDILSEAKFYLNNVDKNNDIFDAIKDRRNIIDVNNGFQISARRYLKSDVDSLESFVNLNRKNPSWIHALNYLSCYEGFTLNDAVSYEFKHNEDNGENNSDGTATNYTWNCGAEGKSSKKAVKQLRLRQIKNALCMLLLSQGAPMLFMGDEFLNTQNGNNNPYCQDNDITWINWKINKTNEEIFDFTKKLINYRKNHKVLHQNLELKNMDYLSIGNPDISYHQDMAWKSSFSGNLLHIGIMLDGSYAKSSDGTKDDTIYIAYNMHWENHVLGLPKLKKNMKWQLELSTAIDSENNEMVSDLENAQDEICVYKRSIIVLKAV